MLMTAVCCVGVFVGGDESCRKRGAREREDEVWRKKRETKMGVVGRETKCSALGDENGSGDGGDREKSWTKKICSRGVFFCKRPHCPCTFRFCSQSSIFFLCDINNKYNPRGQKKRDDVMEGGLTRGKKSQRLPRRAKEQKNPNTFPFVNLFFFPVFLSFHFSVAASQFVCPWCPFFLRFQQKLKLFEHMMPSFLFVCLVSLFLLFRMKRSKQAWPNSLAKLNKQPDPFFSD